MSRALSSALCVLLSASAFAQSGDASFDAANQKLQEQSYSRACDAFTAFIKANPGAPLEREAKAKRAAACLRVGKGNWSELQELADKGERDFARAWATFYLWEQGSRSFEQATPLLKQAAGGEGRTATEARAMLVRGALIEAERNAWNRQRVEQMAAVVLEYATTASQKARARLLRGAARLREQKTQAEGETELLELGRGETEWADDALYAVAQFREGRQEYVAALGLYDEIVKRFSPQSSNMRSSAESQAREIRRPYVNVSLSQVALTGLKPHVQVSWRNVKSAKWALKRVDPLSIGASDDLPDDATTLARAAQAPVSKWTSSLDVKAPHVPGSNGFELDVREPGVYSLEVEADGQSARDWVLVTQTATLTKSDRGQVLVFVADAETGKGAAKADVKLWIDRSGSADEVLAATTDERGLATLKVEQGDRPMVAWTKAGKSYSFARAGSAYGSSWSRENLAYVLMDRPLYKPGEQVGLKLFLRTREVGPSEPLADRHVTLRVSDPTGKTIAEPKLVTNAFGTASFTLALPKNATLGQWYVYVQASDVSYQQRGNAFRVEEYKPPEYTVSVEPLGSAKPGEPVKFKVKAKYYSGGVVANAQGRALVTVSGWQHTWGKWPEEQDADDDSSGSGYEDEEYGYRRGRYNPSWYGGTYAQHTLPFKTGADGSAEVEVPAVKEGGGQDLQYSVQVFVTDASRREISGNGAVKVSARPYFVDLRSDHYLYRPGERVTVKLRGEDANGRPADPEVVVRLMRVAEDGKTTRIAETRTRLSRGKGVVQLDADAIGMVRAEVIDAAAADPAPVLAQTDLWLTSDTRPMAPPGAGLQLYLDRAPLKVGQRARALVVAPQPGAHVLLTMESDAVHTAQVVDLIGRARFVELPLTGVMAPNCFLSAHTFSETAHLMQQRPLKVQGSTVELDVQVGFGQPSTEPGTTVAAGVLAKGGPVGAALETALTIVDEALFYVQPEQKDFLPFFGQHPRQHTVRNVSTHNHRSYMPRPKPVAHAQQQPPEKAPDDDRSRDEEKKAEASSGADARKSVAAPASAAPAAELAAPSPARSAGAKMKKDSAGEKEMAEEDQGAGGGADTPVKARTDFGSSAGWYPELKGAVGERASQKVKLTDSLTSWKAIATVVSKGPHIGRGAGSIRAEKSLMVRLQAPRFFIEGDEVVLSAVVESHLPKAADVDVSITAPGFKELSPGRKTVRVEPDKTVRVDARFKVVELGERTIRAQAKGGGVADAMEWKLNALVHGSAQRQFFAGRLADKFGFELELPEKRKASLTRLELQLSPSLLAVMFDGLPFLAQYPYGCVEQTLSRFVPAVIARRAASELKLPASRLPPDLDDMVQKGLQRLYSFQHGDGGWGWWQTDNTNTWMTAYVIYALALTRDAGVAIDAGALERGRSALLNRLGAAQNEPETHAFAVFALAQSGGAPKQAVDKAFERRTTLSPRARAQLALALLATKDKRARIAVENLDDIVKAAQARKDASVGEANDAWSTSAAIEATAFTLMAYARWDLKSPLLGPLADFLVLRRNGGRWRNTRDTAFAIYALSELAKREGATKQAGSFAVLVNGKEVKRVKYAAGGLDMGGPLVLEDGALKPGKNVVEVKRDGGGTGYYAGTFDVFNMNDFIRGVGGDVKVKRSYTLLGKPSTEKSQAPSEYGMPVESGVRVRVDVEVTANKAVEFVMIEDLKPAGFEAVQQQSGPQVCNYACAHAELRTDRVAMFLTEVRVGTTKLSYELRAEVPGKFSALPARVEAMYAPEIQATADEMRFEVRDEPGGVAAQ